MSTIVKDKPKRIKGKTCTRSKTYQFSTDVLGLKSYIPE